MRSDGIPEDRKTASAEARLDARIAPAVKRRLQMLVILEGLSISAYLSGLLDQALPPAPELAARLLESTPAEAAS